MYLLFRASSAPWCMSYPNTVHSTLHTTQCTLYNALHTAHFTLYTTHYTLHTTPCTLHTAHCTPYELSQQPAHRTLGGWGILARVQQWPFSPPAIPTTIATRISLKDFKNTKNRISTKIEIRFLWNYTRFLREFHVHICSEGLGCIFALKVAIWGPYPWIWAPNIMQSAVIRRPKWIVTFNYDWYN